MNISKTGILTTEYINEYILPLEYQQVDYIEAIGTQYINIGISTDISHYNGFKYEEILLWDI